MRWESKNSKSGYSPACANEWHPTICKKPSIKCANCEHRKLLPLTDQVIYDHLSGEKTIGVYPLLQDETCWFLAIDFDKKSWQLDVQAFMNTCKEFNVPACVERSRSGNGGHVWVFFNENLPASLVRKLGNVLLKNTIAKRFDVGMDSFDRIFPSQDTLPKGGFGNLIALPLQAEPRKNSNSVFIDENFFPYVDQWGYLSQITKMKKEDVNKIIVTHYESKEIVLPVKEIIPTVTDKDKSINFDKLMIIEKNGLYLKKRMSFPILIATVNFISHV